MYLHIHEHCHNTYVYINVHSYIYIYICISLYLLIMLHASSRYEPSAITLSHSFLKKYDFLGHVILEVKVGLKYKRGQESISLALLPSVTVKTQMVLRSFQLVQEDDDMFCVCSGAGSLCQPAHSSSCWCGRVAHQPEMQHSPTSPSQGEGSPTLCPACSLSLLYRAPSTFL